MFLSTATSFAVPCFVQDSAGDYDDIHQMVVWRICVVSRCNLIQATHCILLVIESRKIRFEVANCLVQAIFFTCNVFYPEARYLWFNLKFCPAMFCKVWPAGWNQAWYHECLFYFSVVTCFTTMWIRFVLLSVLVTSFGLELLYAHIVGDHDGEF